MQYVSPFFISKNHMTARNNYLLLKKNKSYVR